MTEIVITTTHDDIEPKSERICLFSKAEIDLLKEEKTASPNYERVLLHSARARRENYKKFIGPHMLRLHVKTTSCPNSFVSVEKSLSAESKARAMC